MKKFRKLIPALALLLVSAVLMSTASYAWFSMNTKVTVTGMEVKTKVGSNLQIAEENSQAAFSTAPLGQVRSALLEPVSTTDGLTYFYNRTSNVTNTGDAKTDSYVAYSEANVASPSNALADDNAGKSHYDTAFQANYGITGTIAVGNVAYGYVDYVFYLKATNANEDATDLRMTECNMLYNGTAITTERAWRIAVFAHEATEYTAYNTDFVAADRKAILTPASATNFTSGKAVTSTSGLGDVTYTSAAWAIDSIPTGRTKYYKVTVRLWLEGEDNTCNNQTFASLTDKYTLTLGFSIDGTTAAVTQIDSVTTGAVATVSGLTASVALGTGTATGYQWFNASTNAAISGATSATYTGSTGTYVYCVVTTATDSYTSNVVYLVTT